jgi:HK97 family phage major capsid protein
MTKEQITEKIELLNEAKQELLAKLNREGRNPNQTEQDILNEINEQVLKLQSTPLSCATGLKMFSSSGGGVSVGGSNVSPTGRRGRDYCSMFNMSRGSLDNGGFKDCAEFLHVMESGRFDPRLQILASLGENVPSSGGFSVPTQFSSEWLDASLPNEIVRNLCRVFPMESETLKIPGWDGSDMTSGQTHGGLTMEFLAEGADATPQEAKMRAIELNAKFAAIYVNSSLELIQDGKNFGNRSRT